MKKLISSLFLITFLNGCSLPLIGSLTTNSITGAVTGNYQRSLVSGGIDFAVHESTGKTPGQHLYAMVDNKYTKKKLEKHFPDKDITWGAFAYEDFGMEPMGASYKVGPEIRIHSKHLDQSMFISPKHKKHPRRHTG